MANSMLRNRMQTSNSSNNNLENQIRQFAENLKRMNKDPNQLLDELISSGKYTNEQINKAKTLASLFARNHNIPIK